MCALMAETRIGAGSDTDGESARSGEASELWSDRLWCELYPDSMWSSDTRFTALDSSSVTDDGLFGEVEESSSSNPDDGDHLFSFFSRRRAFANQVETCVSVIPEMSAKYTFSPFVGYGFF